MIERYSRFNVDTGEDLVLFAADGTEREAYERLRADPHATLSYSETRAGDLASSVYELAAGKYGPSDPDQSAEGTYGATIEGDVLVIRVHRDKNGDSVVSVNYRDRRGRIATNDHAMFLILHAEGDFHARGTSEPDKLALQSAAMDAGDRRVVYVAEMDTHAVDRCMRIVHATVAFAASKGLISGESLVAFRADHVRGAHQHALRPLGTGLMVSRARDMHVTPRVRQRLSVHARRGAEIGKSMLYTA